jgi:dipeptidyl-peptidase-4
MPHSFLLRLARRPGQRAPWLAPAALLLALAPVPSPGQPAASPLTLERITTGPSLVGTAPAAPRWSPDSRTLAFLWAEPGRGARTLYLVSRDGSTPRRLLADESAPAIASVAWLPREAGLVFVRGGHVWRATLPAGDVTQLSTASGEWGELTVSPDGQSLSFLRDGDLWVMPTAGGVPRRLTTVAEAPIGVVGLGTYHRRDVEIGAGTWGSDGPSHTWSPDGRNIAVQYVDRRRVPTFSMPDYLADTARMNVVRRGAPGEVNEVRRVGFVEVASGTLSFVPLADSSSTRVVNIAWSPSGTLLIDRETDDAILRTVHTVVPGSAPRQIWQDRRETRIYNDIHSAWSADGRAVVLTGDLEDRYRLYRLVPGDSAPRALSQADADVAGSALPGGRSLFYVSTAPRPSERHVWMVPDAGGTPRQLTTRAGVHTPYPSPDGRTVALITSSDTVPPELYLLDVRPGASERRITTSTSAEFARVPWLAGTYFTVENAPGQPPLHVRLLLPRNLDNGVKRPVLIGPAYSNTVRNRWAGMYGLLQQYLALERGYIVAQVDVRGSTGYGRDFREAFLMDWGGGDLDDLERVVQHLKTLPYVDGERFGIWGSSYGGTLTVYAMLRKPGLFHAGVAGAAAVDPFLFGSDDVAIARRPQSHPATFERGALQFAARLQGHLLLIHGLQDDVVPFSTVLTLAEAFMREGKDFDLAIAPLATHGWTQRPYYARYLLGKLVEHFDRHLGGPGR